MPTGLEEELKIAGQLDRFSAQRFHCTGLLENRERRAQRRHRKDRRVADLPAVGGWDGYELRLEMQPEPSVWVVPEPAGQSRQLAVGRVTLVHKRSRHRSGASVEILV